MVNQFEDPEVLSSKIVFFQYTKKMINSQHRITDQSLTFLFLGRFWRGCFMIQCFLSLLKTTWYLKNQSEFKPGDSYIDHLLSITQDIFV